MAHVVAHLATWCLLVAAFFVAGRIIIARQPALSGALSSSVPVTVTVGMVLWIQLLLVLCFANLYHASVLTGLALGGGGVGLVVIARSGWRRRADHLAKFRSRRSGLELVSLGAVAATLAMLFLLSLDPEIAWDAATYHLTLPKLFLEAGGVKRVDFFLFSTWPLDFELLYGFAIALQDYTLATSLHFLCGALLVAAIGAYTRKRSGWVAAILAACFFLMEDLVLFELRTAYIELAQALFLFLGFAVWRASRSAASARERRVGFLTAGLLLGAMAGGKPTGVVGLGIVGLLHVFAEMKSRRRPASVLQDLVWLGLPTLTLAAPWYLRSWYEMGDPLHPALYSIFRGGGDEWSAELAERARALYAGFGMGRSPLDFALLPLRLAGLSGGDAGAAFQGSANPFWALLIPLTAFGAWRSREVRVLLAPALLFTTAWFLTCQSLRLLLPALPFLCCAAALSVARVCGDWRNRDAGRALPAGVAACISVALLILVGSVHSARLAAAWGRFSGGTHAAIEGAVPAHFRFVNDRLPADARVLLLNTNQAFFCDREFVSDSLFEASQLNALLLETRDDAELRALFARLGVTHVLERRLNWGIDYPKHFLLARGPGRLLSPIYSDEKAVVYEIAR